MRCNFFRILLVITAAVAATGTPSRAASFGRAIPIAGQAADIALDENAGLLYVANFTAGRVDKIRLADQTVSGSISVAARPNAVAVSPSGQYLLVSHYGSAADSQSNLITTIQLSNGARQTFVTGEAPLGVTFVAGDRALIVTTKTIYMYSASAGSMRTLATFSQLAGTAMPVPQATFPQQITQAACAASGSGTVVWCIGDAGTSPHVILRYDTGVSGSLKALLAPATPLLLPRVSVNQDGSRAMIGYAMFSSDFARGTIVAQYPDPLQNTNIGGHAINSARGLVYAQVFDARQPGLPPFTTLPSLSVMDLDNLTLRERVSIPENIVGRGILTADGKTMYAISDSGVVVLPVGMMEQYPRVTASAEDLSFRTALCDRGVITKTLTITDPGGGSTDFSIAAGASGVVVSPTSGKTPATVQVRVDPTAFLNANGTTVVPLTISSPTAINEIQPVRVLVSNPAADQRGTIVNQPGRLTDIVTNALRNRIYVLRQDTNQFLIFDGSNYSLIGSFRTATTPTRMAFSADGRYALVGHDNSQLINVYDVDAMQQLAPVPLPQGHYARSIAVSNAATLSVARLAPALSQTEGISACVLCAAPPSALIMRVDWVNRVATDLASLGVWENNVPVMAAVTASPNGRTILLAEPDGNVKSYSAEENTFVASRKDFSALSGPFAASDYDSFVVGGYALNSSLVPTAMSSSSGTASGFAFTGAGGFRVSGAAGAAPGVIENYPSLSASAVKPVRMAEAPLLPGTGVAFTRTVAPLAPGSTVVALTRSGFTVLSWSYDAASAPPSIAAVTNAADWARPVAPGSLISIWGHQMSPLNLATKQIPLPTALADSCVMVNGTPIPLLFVSEQQVNAQLPYNLNGSAVMQILTPGGSSDSYYFSVSAAAPAVFRSGVAGPDTGIPTIVRYSNGELITPTNPVRPKDTLTIYLEGMGATTPPVEAGQAAPSDSYVYATVKPSVTLGGIPLDVKFAGLTPGSVGLYQINAEVPSMVVEGISVPLSISQGGGSTQLGVRVVK